ADVRMARANGRSPNRCRSMFKISPADGMRAAAEKGTSARPGGQLCYQPTSVSRRRERGRNVAFWPFATQIDVRSHVGSWANSGHDLTARKCRLVTDAVEKVTALTL